MSKMKVFRRVLTGYGVLGAAITALCFALLLVAAGCSKPAATSAQSAAGIPASATSHEATPAGASTTANAGGLLSPQTTASTSEDVAVPATSAGAPVVAVGAGSAGDPSNQPPATPPAASAAPVSVRLPQLIDLGAKTCIPCKKMAPILEELSATYVAYFGVQFIDVRENPSMAKQYDIRFIPTQIFYDAQARELYRHIGFYSKEEILAKWRALGVDVGK